MDEFPMAPGQFRRCKTMFDSIFAGWHGRRVAEQASLYIDIIDLRAVPKLVWFQTRRGMEVLWSDLLGAWEGPKIQAGHTPLRCLDEMSRNESTPSGSISDLVWLVFSITFLPSVLSWTFVVQLACRWLKMVGPTDGQGRVTRWSRRQHDAGNISV